MRMCACAHARGRACEHGTIEYSRCSPACIRDLGMPPIASTCAPANGRYAGRQHDGRSTHARIHTRAHTPVRARARTHTHARTHARTHTHARTRTHTHAHARTHTLARSLAHAHSRTGSPALFQRTLVMRIPVSIRTGFSSVSLRSSCTLARPLKPQPRDGAAGCVFACVSVLCVGVRLSVGDIVAMFRPCPGYIPFT
jgi:hypothetical protein